MATMKDQIVLTSVACVFRYKGKDIEWFLIKNEDEGGWEMPKTLVRPGESSVRASIRNMAEQGGMNAKVFEEISRSGGATKVNNKIMSQRILYYLMAYKSGSDETLSFEESDWFEHSQALKKLASKRDNQVLKDAKKIIQSLEHDKGNSIETG